MKHTFFLSLFTAGMLQLLVTSCGSVGKADLIVYGNIYTANAQDELAEAFAVKDGKYIYVGQARNARPYIGTKTKILRADTAGLVTPGFTDGHAHRFFVEVDRPENPVNLINDTDSHKDIVRKISTHIAAHPDITYLHAQGFDMAVAGSVITRQELDSISREISICLIDKDGHKGFFNTKALKNALGSDRMYQGKVEEKLADTRFIPGGEFGCYDDTCSARGTMNGYVTEEAMHYVIRQNIRLNTDINDFKASILRTRDDMHAMGYTNYVDAITNSYTTDVPWRALKELDDAGLLQMNVISNYDVFSWDKNIDRTLDEAASLKDQYKTPHFNPVNIQFFIDGTPQAATALIATPYHGIPALGSDYRGIQIWSDSCLWHLVCEANRRGLICHPHTVGDLAVHKALEAYLHANRVLGRKMRNNIVHVRNIRKEDIKTAADNGIAIVGGLFLHTNRYNGKGRWISFSDSIYAFGGYPLKSILDGGARLSGHSETFSSMGRISTPYRFMAAAVTGQILGDTIPYNTRELITPLQALRCVTINGAWQMGLEKRCGSIEVGKSADFVIADKNILKCRKEDMEGIQVTRTYFEGRLVYEAP